MTVTLAGSLAPSSLSHPAVEERLTCVGVERKVRSLGMGLYQSAQLALIGGVLFLQGAVFFLFALATRIDHFSDLSFSAKFAILTATFGGRSLGYLTSSFFQSRRLPMLLGMAGTGIGLGFLGFGFQSSSISLFLRSTVNFFCALGAPAAFASVREILPENARWLGFGLMAVFALIGGFFGFFGLWLINDTSGTLGVGSWQNCAEIISVPAMLFLLVSGIHLQDSPLYFASQGRHVEVNLLLRKIAVINNKVNERIRFVPRAFGTEEEISGWSLIADSTKTLFKNGSSVLLGSITTTLAINHYLFNVEHRFELVLGVVFVICLLSIFAGSFLSIRKRILGGTFVFISAGYLLACESQNLREWIGKHGGGLGGKGWAQLVLVTGLILTKIDCDSELSNLFSQSQRVPGIALTMGISVSIQSLIEIYQIAYATTVPFLPVVLAGTTLMLLTSQRHSTIEDLTEENVKLLA